MPSDIERELLALLHNQQQANQRPATRTNLPELPANLFMSPRDAQAMAPQDRQAIERMGSRVVATEAVTPGDMYAVPQGRIQQPSMGSPDLASLFMNREAQAQADLEGYMTPISGEFNLNHLPPGGQSGDVFATDGDGNMTWQQPNSGPDIQFDAEFGDVEAGGAAQPHPTARFRIDRAPPLPQAGQFPRQAQGQDGEVVSRRGGDGRFRQIAAQQQERANVGRMHTAGGPPTHPVQRGVVSRRGADGQWSSTRSDVSRSPLIRQVDTSTPTGPTAHDILRSGGLKLADD